MIGWTSHESVPTLVIAPDDGVEPIEEPAPLPSRSPRGVDRGTLLTEPNPGQVEAFLERWGIAYATAEQEREPAGEDRRWWQRGQLYLPRRLLTG